MTKLTHADVMSRAPVIPVIALEDAGKAVPLAKALHSGGVGIIEVTLRTDAALDAIRQIASDAPDVLVGAGTVTSPRDFAAAVEAGARFIVSPGATPSLWKTAAESDVPLLAGVANASDIMLGLEYGFDAFKFFPAEAVGGVPALKALHGPFPKIKFCPTGGVSADNLVRYIDLPNVVCVGGTWIAPKDAIEAGDWQRITDLCREAVAMANPG